MQPKSQSMEQATSSQAGVQPTSYARRTLAVLASHRSGSRDVTRQRPHAADAPVIRRIRHDGENKGQAVSSIAQAKKDALVANLVEARKNILNTASALPAKQRDEIFLGSWSVKDLLAHLIGWDQTNHRPHPSGGTGRRENASPADCQVRRFVIYGIHSERCDRLL
jgi:hypothetical protein